MRKGFKISVLGVIFLTLAAICALTPKMGHSETIKIGGTGGALGTMRVLAQAFKATRPDAEIIIMPGLGSGGGRKAVMAKSLDIAVTGKSENKQEKAEGAVVVKYGRTPFVFATSKKNPVSSLTTQQLVEIWSGKIINWPDGSRLRLVLRPESDSDSEMLKNISPAMGQAVKKALAREGMKMAVTDQDSADAIESIPGALGTSTLALILSEKRALKALALDGVAPSVKAAADGSYPYFKSFYLTRRPAAPKLAREFFDFVTSAPGRKILSQLGYW